MLKVAHRFHGYGGLKKVYLNGKSVRGGLIGLKYLSNNNDKPYRAAVVVSKKVHKSAVVRNRIRRRIYEAIRRCEDQPTSGTDMVFTVFSESIKELPSQKLNASIKELINKTK